MQKCAEVPQSSTSTHPFSDVLFFSKISQTPGQNQQNNKLCCLQLLPFKISIKDTSFHISLNSLGLRARMLVEFSLTCIFHLCGKSFKFMVFTFLENASNLGIFAHACPVPHSKFQAEFFENHLLQQQKGGGGL